MTFSIRLLFTVTGLFAIVLAAIISRSALFLELLSFSFIVAILTTLPLAMYDSNLQRRPYWCGFFVGGIGMWVLTMTSGFDELPRGLAVLIIQIPGVSENDVGTYMSRSGVPKTTLNIQMAAAQISMSLLSILAALICGSVTSFHANRTCKSTPTG